MAAPRFTTFACAFALALALAGAALAASRMESDLAAARAVFQANLDAIRHRDRDAYLACYLQSERLARTGPTGFALRYDSLAASAGSGWRDLFEARDLHVVSVREGIVYGSYRYRVHYGDVEQVGISERLFVETPAGWRIAVTSAFPALAGTPPPPLALVGATLVDGTGRAAVRNAVVVLRDGKIECAGPKSRCAVPAGVDTVDLRGTWIAPGLVDAHVHHSQTGWVDGRPDAADLRDRYPYDEVEHRLRLEPERFHRSDLACGVTAVFDVGGFPWTVAMQSPSDADSRSPHIRAAGPLLTTFDHWLNLPAERQFIYLTSDSVARAGVRYLKSLGSSAVKVWFIVRPNSDLAAMERMVTAAGDEAHRVGLPLIVHATGLAEAKAALRAGASLLVHSVWDKPVDAEFLRLAKRNHAMYCPTLTVVDGYRRLYEAARAGQAPVIDDPNHAVDSLTMARVSGDLGLVAARMRAPATTDAKLRAERDRIMAQNLVTVRRNGIPIAMGTDAGNPLTLHGPAVYAEMEAMQAAGLSAMDLVVASTRNGARAMGEAARFGTIEPGKDADLVILGADPTRDAKAWRAIRAVVRGGVVRSIDELRAR